MPHAHCNENPVHQGMALQGSTARARQSRVSVDGNQVFVTYSMPCSSCCVGQQQEVQSDAAKQLWLLVFESKQLVHHSQRAENTTSNGIL